MVYMFKSMEADVLDSGLLFTGPLSLFNSGCVMDVVGFGFLIH